MEYRLIEGDCLGVLKTMEAGSVHCVVTSPPYFGLRDYQTAEWEGGDPECDHKQYLGGNGEASAKQVTSAGTQKYNYRHICAKCGATRIDQQIGLEETPEQYVAKMVEVFRGVWRVLRDDGVLWLNLGDSYAANRGYQVSDGKHKSHDFGSSNAGRVPDGLKPKDLIGIPWRVAFALQADGWYLRSDVIWHKPNPMPESVTDRPTKAHEYLFLLTKSARYYYDAEAVKEPSTGQTGSAADFKRATKESLVPGQAHVQHRMGRESTTDNGTRNKRSVWTVATQPYSGAHFAVFPAKLIEPCILAGTSEKGCCSECGAPWERVTEKERIFSREQRDDRIRYGGRPSDNRNDARATVNSTTTGWQPTCTCSPSAPIPCTVLDPFSGAGTTGVVSGTHGRNYIGIELNPDYLAMSDARIGEVYRVGRGEFRTYTDTSTMDDLPLFAEATQ